jgi:raffinose/stachyose/melibiose transport system substrate-binding protein
MTAKSPKQGIGRPGSQENDSMIPTVNPRQSRSLVSVAVLALLLGGCAGPAPTATPARQGAATAPSEAPTAATETPAASKKPVKIRIMSWHGPESLTGYYKGYKQIADAYTARNPHVTFEFVFQPLDGYKELLDTQFVSGSAPEIIHMQPWMFGEYANKGVLHNLNNAYNSKSPYASTERWIDSFAGGEPTFAGVRSSNKYGGIFFVPNDSNPLLSIGVPFFYNKDLFAKAGLDPEKTPANWQEYTTILKTLKEKGITPIAADNARWVGWSLGQVGYQFGEKHVNQFYNEKFTSGNRGVEFYWDKVYVALANGQLADAEFYGDMLTIWKDYAQYWQDGWPGTAEADAPNLFMTGQAAILQAGFWDYAGYANLIGDKFKWGIFPIPVIDGATSKHGIGKYNAPTNQQDYGFTVNAAVEKDKDLEAAVVDFLMFFSSKEQQSQYVQVAKSFSPIDGVDVPAEIKGFVTPVEKSSAAEVVGSSFIEWGDGAIWPGLAQEYLTGKTDLKTFQTKVAESSQKASQAYVESMLGTDGYGKQIADAEAKLAELKSSNAPEVVIKSQQGTVENLKLRLEMMQTYYKKK